MTEAVDDFLRYAKAERGLSAHTVAAYRRDLGEFVGFLQGYLAAPDWSWETIDRTAPSTGRPSVPFSDRFRNGACSARRSPASSPPHGFSSASSTGRTASRKTRLVS
jgi:hypothetical protein